MKGFAKEGGKLFALAARSGSPRLGCCCIDCGDCSTAAAWTATTTVSGTVGLIAIVQWRGGGHSRERASVFTPKGVRSAHCVPSIWVIIANYINKIIFCGNIMIYFCSPLGLFLNLIHFVADTITFLNTLIKKTFIRSNTKKSSNHAEKKFLFSMFW